MAKASDTLNKIFVSMDERPKCSKKGCMEPRQHTGNYSVAGYPFWRKTCTKHHNIAVGKKHGVKSIIEVMAKKQGLTVKQYQRQALEQSAANYGMTVQEYQRYNLELTASSHGMTVVDYLNSKHPYRKHRKEYCENRDKRLGFKCNYKIRFSGQLQVDHINGNPKDHRKVNLQTLCCNCHAYKTNVEKDYATPGRKTLKKQGLFTKFVG